MESDVILETFPLGFQWPTVDPFLFCVHHDDAYPAGNAEMGPAASLAGRAMGQDFEPRDGWRMYHGMRVPGFPQHPHRGFETITIARRGFIDHSDSLGATARYGEGDVQWMTAGRGIVHAEMFPLLRTDAPNPGELFQIWLNLPRADKFVEPHFKMLWAESIPTVHHRDEHDRTTAVRVIAGTFFSDSGETVTPPSPPPSSYASNPASDVCILSLHLDAGAKISLAAARAKTVRMIYFFRGSRLRVGAEALGERTGAVVRADAELSLEAGDDGGEVLMLQARPLDEPVVQHGPFVMNTRTEISDAFRDYQRTQFGGWPWHRDDPVHARDRGRFALHADGTLDEPPSAARPSE